MTYKRSKRRKLLKKQNAALKSKALTTTDIVGLFSHKKG